MRRSRSSLLTWDFPLPRTHTGILLGNGLQGLMIWGRDTLRITVARAGFWDHRGGRRLAAEATFAAVRRLLEAGDEEGIKALFAAPAARSGERRPPHPRQYGGGRLEIRFPDGLAPAAGSLDIRRGIVRIVLRNAAGQEAGLRIRQAVQPAPGEVAWIEADDPGLCRRAEVTLTPFHETCRTPLADFGIEPPERWREADGDGFLQRLPEDEPLAVGWTRGESEALILATALGGDAAGRVRAALRQAAAAACRQAVGRANDRWWRDYWRDIPLVSLPDPELQHAYDYGVYRQAGLNPPHGVAATLQGPWMEEYQIPPWSNDYHFNINVQMVYGPCLPANRAAHMTPLWNMIREWLPELQADGERFFGVPEALMLPHAVDDRGRIVGTFWTGTIDHACTAWMALMAWQHYRYTLEEKVLREMAWPLLKGAFNGYHAMTEQRTDAAGRVRWSLPVTVSPEYNGCAMNAWGRDASFQLAAFRRVAEALIEAAGVLGEDVDDRWRQCLGKLPPYSVFDPRRETAAATGRPRIALWQGQDLENSHRHHSHLAGIHPFAAYDPLADEHRGIVAASIQHWTAKGPGLWTGWCVPWAAILCARLGLADAAVLWLHFWKRNFTNIGHGTLHNADFSGVTAIADGALDQPDMRRPPDHDRREIMQMDAAMGAVTAVLELLVQCRRDGIHVLPALPKGWRSLRFEGVRTEGAFLVGAEVGDGRVTAVTVKAEKGGPLRIFHGLGERWLADGEPRTGPLFATSTRPGQTIRLAALEAGGAVTRHDRAGD